MINPDGTIQALEFEIDGTSYRVIESRYGGGHNVWSARDIVMNLSTGKKMNKTRREWKNWYKKKTSKNAA